MSGSEGSGAGQREVAYRLFAAEFEGADFDYSEGEDERAPNYVITPTGARANRLFVVGVLTEIEQVSEDVLRARVVDPTGAFVLYAGQYQPDEQAFLEKATPPAFVAVTGKARTFQPDDSDQVFTSVRPESISEVDAETRDRWTVQTAEQTIDRIRWLTTALTLDAEDVRAELGARGADDGLAHGISLAIEHYGTTPTYLDALYDLALDAARVVAGDADEVEEFTTAPDASGEVTVADLAARLSLPDEDGDTSAVADVTGSETTASTETGTAEASAPETETAESPSSETTDADPSDPTESEPEPDSSDDSAEPEQTTSSAEPVEESDEPSSVESGPVETTEETEADGADELGDFEPEEFELEEETREEIEEEFGTEFQSGSEVDEPGNADIETPDPEELADEEPDASEPATTEPPEETATAPEADETDESADESEADAETSGESAADESVDDPQVAVVELMGELDDGDGAPREELLATMDERYGIDSETTEEAIQDALMDGQCYQLDDDHLKPI
jgi:RPA family protein